MKTLLLTLLICLCSVSLFSQNSEESSNTKPQFTLGDDCGNPAEESQIYDSRKGKITKILSANKFLFDQISVNGNKVKDRFTVKLAGIDANSNKAILKNKLKIVLLDQEVEIFGNLNKKDDKEFSGIIWSLSDDEDIDEVNIYLLENGIAKYKPFESANLVSMVMPCRLQKAEEKAKEAKIGIWAK